MAKSTIKIRRPAPKRVARTEVEEPVVEPDVVVEEDTVDYGAMTVAQLRTLCTDRELSKEGRKSILIGRLEEDDDQGEEPEVVAPKAKKAKKAAPKPSESDDVTAPADWLEAVMNELRAGEAITFAKTSADSYVVTIGGSDAIQAVAPAPKKKGLRGAAFEKEVRTPEYLTWLNEDAGTGKAWSEMTHAEKCDYADELECDWDEHDDVRVDNIRMTTAVRVKLGIEPYKEQYQSRAARKALREG